MTVSHLYIITGSLTFLGYIDSKKCSRGQAPWENRAELFWSGRCASGEPVQVYNVLFLCQCQQPIGEKRQLWSSPVYHTSTWRKCYTRCVIRNLISFEVKSICFAFVFLNFCANILFDEVNTWCYRPDESILTKDEVRGWYTLIRSIKPCIDWY